MTIDQVGMLADPAQTGIAGQRLFQDRGRIDIDAVTKWTAAQGDFPGQSLQASAHQFMVIAACGITRNISAIGLFQNTVQWLGFVGQVIHAH